MKKLKLTMMSCVRLVVRLALLVACMIGSESQADNKALIMGTGEFLRSDILPSLPGIDIDLATMEKVALDLGYGPHHIRQISGSQLTLAKVRAGFRWLREGVGPDDHAFVYFSGHGYQIIDRSGDESDGYDEILPLYRYSGDNHEFLLDDELQQLIASINSARTHVFIDACCSGSSDRDIDLGQGLDGEKLVAKSVGCPSNSRNKVGDEGVGSDVFSDDFNGSKGAVFVEDSAGSTWEQSAVASSVPSGSVMYIGAAQDDESAVASSGGSYFTRALSAAFAQGGRELSPLQLAEYSRNYLRENLPAYRVHTPNLLGPSAQQSLASYYLVPSRGSSDPAVNTTGPTLQQLREGYGQLDILSLQNGSKLAVGDDIAVDFFLEKAGYINVLVIDAEGRTHVLFPNAIVPLGRHFEAGSHHLPEGFGIQAAEPLGNTDIWVLYSPSAVNLYESSMRGKAAQLDAPFPVLTEEAARSLKQFEFTAEQSKILIGAIGFEVCDSGKGCQ